ncbi:MAG: hypothetical protein Q9170_008225, partial [Blastenia crenularia]
MPSAYQIHPDKTYSWRDPAALSNLHFNTDVPKPDTSTLPPKSALVRIRAAAINARDMMVIALDKIYPVKEADGLSPCADGAGEIEAVGEGSVWKVGERVVIHPCGWLDGHVPDIKGIRGKGAEDDEGTLREYGVFEDTHLHRAPSHLSFEELAALPIAGATAINALLFGPKPLEKGMTVLTQGTGGVSCFVIQLASSLGATVICTTSSPAKETIARFLGATHTINYHHHPAFSTEILRLTSNRGVDHTIELGGASSLLESIRSTKQGGLISLVGILGEDKPVQIVGEL